MPLPAPGTEAGAVAAAVEQPGDAELVARARRGDGLAFELIMRRHNRRLFRLARSLVGRDHEAEDVLQEAYVRAYARLADLAEGAALGAWLARIVANEALGRLRAATRVVSLDAFRSRAEPDGMEEPEHDQASDLPDPERLAASGELRRLLEAAVDALPAEFRTVFVLREVEGLSTAETAACLGLRPETVKTRLHRARRQLQERLTGELLAVSAYLFEFQGRRCDRVVSRVQDRIRHSPPASGDAALGHDPVRPGPPNNERSGWLGRLIALFQRGSES
ncbi:MAG: RNA polymerase sigma factor [Geminicoccaceae bacterium]